VIIENVPELLKQVKAILLAEGKERKAMLG
jgi:hypothetical protein